MTHPDVPAEQAHVDHAYRRLAAMRAAAASMLQDAFAERGGTFQAVTERDIRVRTSLGRLEQLQIGRESLVFGRIDAAVGGPGNAPSPVPGHMGSPATGERPTAGATPAPAGGEHAAGAAPEQLRLPESGPAVTGAETPGEESFHIGRLAISGEDQEPLVVDWRAPIAEPFYRATGAHPMGLSRRRHFLTEGQTVLDLEDELFDVEGSDSGVGLGLSGPQVLIATLERSRTGRMRDIVATVQREQDEIIRAALPGILVVQGGPGTGKTAVALHRAAYLLYTHRFPLESQGVLVVGPNPTFLRYIEHVLPSLDENGVELTTVAGLVPGVRATRPESPERARLKGDPRMARVVAKAVADRQRPLRRTVEVPLGSRVVRITPQLSAQVVASAKRRPGTHNARRRTVETLLWRGLLPQVEPSATDTPTGPGAASEVGDGSAPTTPEELGRVLRRIPAVAEALERMWPLLTPENLLHDLLGARALVGLAAAGVLDEGEQALLYRGRQPAGEPLQWSEPDLPLLDEAAALLGPPRRRPADGEDAIRTYGHLIVDEAQDLTPMQLRMLARRSLSGSMTVVGDIAQSTGTWAPTGWAQVVEHLPARRGWRLVELTVNYRTPAEIMQVAARVLERAAPGMRPPEAVRASGEQPRIFAAARVEGTLPGDSLPGLTATAVRSLLAGEDGVEILAVIAPPGLVGAVGAGLDAAGIRYGVVGRGALDERVTLLSVEEAKGLEFDNVVVVEPARLAREAAQGLRSLYVALTRATRRLAVVHSEPVPESLRDGLQTPA